MAISSFIPEIWNSEMLLSFQEQAVAAALVNRQYEGDAKRGNSVRITTATRVVVKNYKTGVSGARTTAADPVADSHINLLIDQEKSFDFYVDDIDRAQAAGSLEAYTTSAGEAIAEDADKFILALAAGGDASPDTTVAANGDALFDKIRDLRKKLNKAHVPAGNRVLVCNAEFEAMLLSASAKLTSANTSGSPAGLREATIGRLLGFDIVMSENLPDTVKPMAVAFYRPSVAFVSQITDTEAMRAQDRFADRLRGLHVYGGLVVRPEGVAVYHSA